MDINQILDTYDAMFGVYSLEQIDTFLEKTMEDALAEGDVSSIITLVNEMIGFCRDTGKVEKGMAYCSQLITLMRDLEMEGTVPYATSMLNIGNAYRAFGKLEEAMECYQTVEVIYDQDLDEYDFRFASLYNNWSLLYQEMEEFVYAKKALYKALAIVSLYSEAKIEQATTHTNLAVTLLRLGEVEEAEKHLKQGMEIYEEDGGKDFHYSAALAAAGDACYLRGRQKEAIRYYKMAMKKLEKHVGRTEAYKRIAENCLKAEEALKLQIEEEKEKSLTDQQIENKTQKIEVEQEEKKLEVKQEEKKPETDVITKELKEEKTDSTGVYIEMCREFYTQSIAPMIHTDFPEYEQQIAVGLVGEGSECFGYEDNYSKDHNFELGLCIWIPEELNWTIGKKLEQAYQELLIRTRSKEKKTEKNNSILQRNQRRGVMTINEFYSYFLKQSKLPDCLTEWMQIPDGALAASTNGVIFRDDAGIFTGIRKKLKEYYPEEVFRCRLAEELTYFSQYGQYNYSRMMARQDYVTAKISLAEWMVHTMRIVYLLNRTYEPYYKWLRKGMESLPILPEVGDMLDAVADMPDQREAWNHINYCADEINGADQIALTVELIARYLLAELQRQGLVKEDNTYLASHAEEILLGRNKKKDGFETQEKLENNKTQYMDLISRIVHLEWRQFYGVNQEGERAECQKDWKTFQIMRESQYLTWNQELLVSYLTDLLTAEKNGWNLVMEKYARMMESTVPEEYQKLKELLPKREIERIVLQEEIIKIQVDWMEEFSKKYPLMAENARKIHTIEDMPWETSYETYLRGELGTYSDQTLELYGRFVVELARKEKNLAYMIMENTVEFYGYSSVDEAEASLFERQ